MRKTSGNFINRVNLRMLHAFTDEQLAVTILPGRKLILLHLKIAQKPRHRLQPLVLE
jgi:hypothetical protein